jgi:hypothetical protein
MFKELGAEMFKGLGTEILGELDAEIRGVELSSVVKMSVLK